MVGIVDFGGYVPAYRLGPWTENWSGKNERAVANFDEDAITMAVAALEDCLHPRGARNDIDALYLASTTLPYEEKQASVVVAAAGGLDAGTQTADVTHTLRAGSDALISALDAVKAGRIRNAAVVASDCRMAQPGSNLERELGDGSASIVVGSDGVIAEFEGYVSVANEINAVWRTSGDRALSSWEDRFVFQEGYLDSLKKLADAVKEKLGKSVADFDRVVLVSPDERRRADGMRVFGLSKDQVGEGLFAAVGSTGAAHALLELNLVLQDAQPGQQILVINYGDGADAIALRVTDEITKRSERQRGTIRRYIDSKLQMPSYMEFLKWRGFLQQSSGVRRPSGSGPSAAALHREQDQVLKFNGVKCKNCSTVMYPPQRLCIECRAQDNFEKVRLVSEPAKVFTYSMDYIAGSFDVPLVLCVVDFDCGARAVLMMTDRDVDKIAVDMPVQPSLRIARGSETMPNYYWKVTPLREAV